MPTTESPPTNDRCKAFHNPGIWPYTARCEKYAYGHMAEHRDQHGKTWPGDWQADWDRDHEPL